MTKWRPFRLDLELYRKSQLIFPNPLKPRTMATRVKARETKSEIVAYSELAIRNNASAVDYCRTSMAALSGSTAGESESG